MLCALSNNGTVVEQDSVAIAVMSLPSEWCLLIDHQCACTEGYFSRFGILYVPNHIIIGVGSKGGRVGLADFLT